MIKKIIKKAVNFLFKNNNQKDLFLEKVFSLLGRDPLLYAYNRSGILNYWNDNMSGEYYLISKILPDYIQLKDKSVIFDVGANIGEYSLKIASIFSKSMIYSFEPNINTFKILIRNVEDYKTIKPINIGLSEIKKETEIFTYSKDLNSEHASLYKDVFSHLHKNNSITTVDIKLESLDEFCQNNNIECIDFLKIDTEGHELQVLKGSTQMISNGKIKIIQFEFNEMNIMSRVFLKDFYQILKDYKIYRLSEKGLIPLFRYDSINEIFKYQNLLAIHNIIIRNQ